MGYKIQMKKETKWVYLRDGEVCKIFDNRNEAILYYKEMLKQTLKDMENHNYNNYDHSIKVKEFEFKPIMNKEIADLVTCICAYNIKEFDLYRCIMPIFKKIPADDLPHIDVWRSMTLHEQYSLLLSWEKYNE